MGPRRARDALRDGNLGLSGTHSPGQIIVPELLVPPLRGLRCIYAAWVVEDQSRPSPSLSMNGKD